MSKIAVLLFVLLISFTSALSVNPQGQFEINKTYSIDKTFQIEIVNENSFDFYNVTLVSNPHIEMAPIDRLNAGFSINRTVTVVGEDDFNGEIKIKGFYEAELGASNETYNINIDFINGLDVCDLTLIKGDSVNWINNVPDSVSLIHDGVEAKSINEEENYLFQFNQPQEFTYYFNRVVQFTDICTITVLDDSGYINDPAYDASIFLDIDVNYQPTTLEYAFTEHEYEMSPFTEQQGVFTIKNVGEVVAKDIRLSGDWFSFSADNFDLQPGYTKSISYTITPVTTQTSDTNKTYNKDIIIEGNFETKRENMSIFVSYADIDDGSYREGKSLLELVEEYCALNPEVCGGGTRIVYRNVNDSEVNVSFTQKQVLQIYQEMFKFFDNQELHNAFMKESYDDLESRQNDTDYKFNTITNKLEDVDKSNTDRNTITLALFWVFFTGIISVLILFFVYKQKSKTTFRRILNSQWKNSQDN